jgi:hypothetical protein
MNLVPQVRGKLLCVYLQQRILLQVGDAQPSAPSRKDIPFIAIVRSYIRCSCRAKDRCRKSHRLNRLSLSNRWVVAALGTLRANAKGGTKSNNEQRTTQIFSMPKSRTPNKNEARPDSLFLYFDTICV